MIANTNNINNNNINLTTSDQTSSIAGQSGVISNDKFTANNITITDNTKIIEDHSPDDEHGITMYADSTRVMTHDFKPMQDTTYQVARIPKYDLNNIFNRPIKVHTFTWETNANLREIFYPWEDILTNSLIIEKTNNFYNIRFNIRLRFVVNGTSFLYGKYIVAYMPPILANMPNDDSLWNCPNKDAQLMKFSQLPSVIMDLETNAIAEMIIPWFYPANYISPSSDSDFLRSLGKITMAEIGRGLRKVQAAASESVNITVFAWAEQVELTGPVGQSSRPPAPSKSGKMGTQPKINTKAPPVTSNDEYTHSKPSHIAKAVASAAGMLRNVPIIGDYAMATQVAANGATKILEAFGLSKPTNLNNENFVKPILSSSIANSSGLDTATKLTFDPKQETTIDSKIAGIQNSDDMLMATIFARESFLSDWEWKSVDEAEDIIGGFDVNPVHFLPTGHTLYESKEQFAMTSVTFGSVPFTYWSGTLKYRISIIASKWHRGRLRITYTPGTDETAGVSTDFNQQTNYLIDLETTREFEFSISWMSHNPYHHVNQEALSVAFSGDGSATSVIPGSNGRIRIEVLNELTSPDTTADVTILCFMSGGEDFEVFAPNHASMIHGATAMPRAQSNIGQTELSKVVRLVGEPKRDILEKKRLIHHGDPILSVKQVLRRFQVTANYGSKVSRSNSNIKRLDILDPVIPTTSGYNQIQQGDDVVGSDLYVFNPTETSSMAWFMAGYGGYRGGMRYKVVPVFRGLRPTTMLAHRLNDYLLYQQSSTINAEQYDTGSPSTVELNVDATKPLYQGWSGCAMTNYDINPCLDFEAPYHNSFRFYEMNVLGLYQQFTNQTEFNAATNFVHISVAVDDLTGSSDEDKSCFIGVQVYKAVAEDFNLVWYLGAPSLAFEFVLQANKDDLDNADDDQQQNVKPKRITIVDVDNHKL